MSGIAALQLAVCAALIPCTSKAQDNVFDRQAYVGFSAGQSSFSVTDTGGTGLTLTEDSSSATQIVLGRDFSTRLTAEFHYSDLGSISLNNQTNVSYTDIGLSTLIYLYGAGPSRKGFAVYSRLGVGQIETEGEVAINRDHPVHLVAGAGIEYSSENGIALRGDYIYHDEDASAATLSLLYRFGANRERMIELPLVPVQSTPAPTLSENAIPAQTDKSETDINEPIENLAADTTTTTENPATQTLQADPLPSTTPLTEPVYPTSTAVVDSQSATQPEQQPPLNTLTAEPANANAAVTWVEESDSATRYVAMAATTESFAVSDSPLDSLTFLTGSIELTSDSLSVLNDIVTTMRQSPDVTLDIESHTDNRGDPSKNLELSRQRAISVAKYLASRGIEIYRINAMAFGGTQPIASNETVEGRRTNRRVELQYR